MLFGRSLSTCNFIIFIKKERHHGCLLENFPKFSEHLFCKTLLEVSLALWVSQKIEEYSGFQKITPLKR